MATRDLQVFTNDAFGTIRTVGQGDKVYFCGKDVAAALGYANTKDALARHCKGVVKRYPIVDALGRTQEARFISEGDLYRLIFSSKLPAAQDFEAWVVDEVLPSIRKHGLYITDRVIDEIRTNPKALLAMLQSYVEEKERNEALAAENLQQAQLLLEATPKVSYYDMVLQSDSLLTLTEIAKDYGMSARKLNTLLHDAGVQFRQSGRWFLYAKFAEQGYTQSKIHEYGEGKTRTHMYWTQKGRLFVYDLLKNRFGLLPVIERGGGVA